MEPRVAVLKRQNGHVVPKIENPVQDILGIAERYGKLHLRILGAEGEDNVGHLARPNGTNPKMPRLQSTSFR